MLHTMRKRPVAGGVITVGVPDGGIGDGAAALQSRFRFAPSPQHDVNLWVTDALALRPFRVEPPSDVVVSTWQQEGICLYAGVDPEVYVLTCGLLGLVQWRALYLNELLREEDLVHSGDHACLYSVRDSMEEYALLFDEPRVCPGCIAFYRCLGAEAEVEALLSAVAALKPAA